MIEKLQKSDDSERPSAAFLNDLSKDLIDCQMTFYYLGYMLMVFI